MDSQSKDLLEELHLRKIDDLYVFEKFSYDHLYPEWKIYHRFGAYWHKRGYRLIRDRVKPDNYLACRSVWLFDSFAYYVILIRVENNDR